MKLLSFGEIIWDNLPTGKKLGGAPLNFAAHSALLGADAVLVSAVGSDPLGKEALGMIRELGVGCDHISVLDGVPTGRCDVTLSSDGVPSYDIVRGVAYDRIGFPTGLKGELDAIAFGTLALREEHNREMLKRIVSEYSFAEIFTDLNIRPPFYSRESVELCLSLATVVKISDEELPTVLSLISDAQPDLPDAPAIIAARYPNIRIIVITKGKDGADCYDVAAGKTYTVAAVPAEVVSTVGAGDSFGAAFLTEYFKTHDISRAMTLAARLSAFVVSCSGAIPEGTRDFLATLTHPDITA